MTRVFLLCLLTLGLNAQQEFGTYFFNDLQQSADLNPSFDAPHKIVVALPSLYGMVHQRGISAQSALKGRLLDGVTNQRNQIMFGSHASLLNVSYKHKRIRYHLSHGYKQFADFQVGSPLISLIAGGNANTIGGSVELNPNAELTSYSETSFGMAWTGDLSFGFKVKFLNGIQNFYTERSDLSLSVNDDIYQLQLQGDLLVNSSFPIDLNNTERLRWVRFNFIPRNTGLALDLGLNYRKGPLTLAASVLDIGSLTWRDKVHNYEASGNFVYDGASLSEVIDGDFNFLDTIGGAISFTDERQAYRHFVPTKYYASAMYDFSEKVQLGALFYAQQNFGRTNGALAFNLQRHWNRKHAIALQYGVVGYNPVNIGLSGYTTLGPVQVFTIFDNVLGMVNALGAENYNFRLGINLVFAREPQHAKVIYAYQQ